MVLEDEEPKRLLVRELARRILEADWSQPTRADNLNRGLSGARIHLCSPSDQWFHQMSFVVAEVYVDWVGYSKGGTSRFGQQP